MKTDLREMLPTDIRAVRDLHRGAFQGYLNTRLGNGYLDAFFSWFCRAEEAIAVCALQDGKIAGYVVGAPVGYSGRMSRALLLPAGIGMLLRPWVLASRQIRAAAISRLLAVFGAPQAEQAPDLPEPVMSLVGIAVDDRLQGQGIGQALLNRFERESRSRHAKALRLSVYADNSAAHKAYVAAGWTHFPRNPPLADFFYKHLSAAPTPVDATAQEMER